MGGLDPSCSVSMVLDIGTNNKELMNDPLYVVRNLLHPGPLLLTTILGWPSKCFRGEEYDKFIEKCVLIEPSQSRH